MQFSIPGGYAASSAFSHCLDNKVEPTFFRVQIINPSCRLLKPPDNEESLSGKDLLRDKNKH